MLPGLPSERIDEHLHIEATRKTLTVSGEWQPMEPSQAEKLLINQFRYGKFSKQLTFPDGVAADDIQASYSNGILEVILPKAAESQKRSVQIQVKS